jgi:hypothetical protein
MDRSFYDEYIDPNSFFQNQSLLNTFAQKIKQIPEDIVNKMSNEDKLSINENLRSDGLKPRFDEPAILQADPEMEKMELMRKYGISDTSQNPNPLVESKKQMERFASILQELQEEVDEEETIQRVEVTREENIFENRSNEIGKTNEIIQEDPIITMFKNVKRNREFKITIDLENKIPRPDFIEMMEDSYNTSLIEFLATEFTNSILDNPDIIKNKIISEINNIVYGNKIKEEKVEVKAETKTVKSRSPRQKKLI